MGGFLRVYITDGSLENSFAISLSLFLIVLTSVLTGTMLPFGLAKAGVDPANAGTSVQVSILWMLLVSPRHARLTSGGCTRFCSANTCCMLLQQVLMDISGVAITCFTCNLMLNHLSKVLLPA